MIFNELPHKFSKYLVCPVPGKYLLTYPADAFPLVFKNQYLFSPSAKVYTTDTRIGINK